MPSSDASRYWIAAEVGLGLCLVALPAALGGAPEWTLWLLLSLSTFSLGAWLLGASRNHRRWGWHPVLVAPAVLVAVAALQLVPLPPAVLAWVSPPAAGLRDFALVPLGLAGWRPLSMDPSATARGLARLVSLGMLLFVSLELGRLEGVRRRLFKVLGAAGALTAVVGFLHLLAGADTLLGVHAFSGNVQLLTPFGNTNHLAAWLLLSGTVAAGVAMHAESRDGAVAWGAAALVCGVGVFFTFSRGGIATFVATWGLVGASVLARRGGGLKSVLPWVLIGGTVLAGAFLSFEQLVERADSLSTLEKFKVTKVGLWPMFARGLLPFWRLGAGLGAFELAFTPAQTTELSVTFTHPEMIALQWAYDVGVPLAAAAALFAAWLSWRLWTLVARSATDRAALLALWGLVLHDVFDFALELNAVSAAAVIVLGLLCGLDGGGARKPVRVRGLLLGGLPVAAAAAALAWGTPGHLAAERRLSEALAAGRSYVEVRALAVELIDRHPADWVPYAQVAQLAAREADPRETLAWINRVLALRPFDGPAHVAAAQALLRLGRPLQALGELKLAWAVGESRSLDLGLAVAAREGAWDRVLLGTAGHLERAYWRLRGQQKHPEALALLQAARSAPPAPEVAAEAARLLVRHEAELGDPAAALEALSRLPAEQGATAELVVTRVQALGKLRRLDEAVRELEQLLSREPSNVQAGFMLADLLASLERPAQAREVLLRLRPFLSEAGQRSAGFQREAALWVQEQRFPRALDALQTASRIEPARADLHYRLAEVYERMGSLHSALDEVRRGRLLDSPDGARSRDAWVARLEAAAQQLP